MTAVLRRMRWWDADAVLGLERELFPDPWSYEQLLSELAYVPETRWYAVAESGERVVGYAGLRAVPPDAEINTVAVASAEQGTGLGSRLVEAMLGEARDRGCTQVFLEVRADNVSAQGLYTRHGFEQIGTRPGYYGPGQDALVMRGAL